MGGWFCLACDGENPSGTRYCGACGTPRPAADSETLWGCSTCGAANIVGAVFCGHCGDARVAVARHSDERRLVTALFADISGFTTLAEKLEDAEALHAVIEPVIAGLARVAERYGGFIAKYAGDALLVFFGAPVAHEDDPARALLVALEMQAALPGLLDGLPVEARGMSMHVGVNTGRVVSGQFGGDARSDYSILGEAVIVAQRLESVAPPGTTYVGGTTVELAGDGFIFEEVGELQLKGKTKSVHAWKLRDRRIVATATTSRLGPLVGRLAEVEAIEAMIDGLSRRRGGGVVGILGEPGVGKSRLLAEARIRAGDRRSRWLQTRCLAYGAALPYWPFAELLRSVAGIGPAEPGDIARARLAAAPGVTGRSLPYMARLVGATTHPGELPDESELVRQGLHEGVSDWLVELGQQTPTVLSIEDVHWIDSASLAMVRHLTRVVHGWPLALVLTAREEGRAQIDEITEPLDPSWSATFTLGPLDQGAIFELLSYLLGGEPPPELIQLIDARTGGNPLFVEELTRSLVDDQALDKVNDRWRMRPGWEPSDVPDTVERVLAGRIDLLPPEQSALLRTASVIGRLVRVPLLRAVAGDDDLDDRLEGLAGSGLLDPTVDGHEPGYLFHHALVQDVAYERLLRKDRRDLHRRVAEVAVGLYGSGDDVIDLLARHAYLGELPGAAAILARAADRARRLFANDEALAHLAHALEVAPPEEQRGLELQAGDLRNVVGDYAGALQHFTAAGDDPRAARGRADVLRKLGEPEAALAVAVEALAGLPSGAAERPGLLLQQGWCLHQRGDMEEACAVLREAIVAADAGEPDMVMALAVLATASVVDPADAVQLGLFARRFAEHQGDQQALGMALRVVGGGYTDLQRYDEAAATLRSAIDVARRTGEAQELGASLVNLGRVELERGRLEEAVALDEAAAAHFERMDHSTGVAIAWGNMAEKLLAMGRIDEAEQRCRAALDKAASIGFAVVVADATLTLAAVREHQGRLAEAVDLAAESAARFAEIHQAAMAERAAGMAARLRATGS